MLQEWDRKSTELGTEIGYEISDLIQTQIVFFFIYEHTDENEIIQGVSPTNQYSLAVLIFTYLETIFLLLQIGVLFFLETTRLMFLNGTLRIFYVLRSLAEFNDNFVQYNS